MSTESTRTSLLRRVRDSTNQEAWREFEARYGDLILRFARRLRLSPVDAEDVRQLVLLSLASALPAFRYDARAGRFRTYLGRVVRHAVGRLRSRVEPRWKPLEPALLGRLAYAREPADEEWEREWKAHHIRLAMESLRPEVDAKSLAIFERLIAGDSVDRVAAAFGATRAAVQKVKERMRARLEERIAEQIEDEDASEAGA